MTYKGLKQAWPDFANIDDVSDCELVRIVAFVNTADKARIVWENDSWWRDHGRINANDPIVTAGIKRAHGAPHKRR